MPAFTEIRNMVVAGVLHWKQVSFNINSNWQVRQEVVEEAMMVFLFDNDKYSSSLIFSSHSWK